MWWRRRIFRCAMPSCSRLIARSGSTAYVAFVNDHPLLSAWLSYGYTLIRWPLFAIPVILTAARRYCRLQDFTLAFGLALAATTILSALVPASDLAAGVAVALVSIAVARRLGREPSQSRAAGDDVAPFGGT